MRFLFVDRILESTPSDVIRGVKHITADDHYLSIDSDGRRYFTSSLVGETLGQLAAWNVMHSLDFAKRPVAGVVSCVTVNRHAYVGETLLLESKIDSLDDTAVQYHSVARVGDEVVLTIDGALGPLLPMADFIEPDEVRRQYEQINRPGAWPPSFPVIALSEEKPMTSQTSMCFDALLHNEPDVQMTAIKRINRAASYFPDHFPRKPVLPMTILLECKLNLAREFLKRSSFSKQYQISEMRRIKMNEFVYSGDVIVCSLSVKRQDDMELLLSFRSEVDGKRVCVMELLLTGLGV